MKVGTSGILAFILVCLLFSHALARDFYDVKVSAGAVVPDHESADLSFKNPTELVLGTAADGMTEVVRVSSLGVARSRGRTAPRVLWSWQIPDEFRSRSIPCVFGWRGDLDGNGGEDVVVFTNNPETREWRAWGLSLADGRLVMDLHLSETWRRDDGSFEEVGCKIIGGIKGSDGRRLLVTSMGPDGSGPMKEIVARDIHHGEIVWRLQTKIKIAYNGHLVGDFDRDGSDDILLSNVALMSMGGEDEFFRDDWVDIARFDADGRRVWTASIFQGSGAVDMTANDVDGDSIEEIIYQTANFRDTGNHVGILDVRSGATLTRKTVQEISLGFMTRPVTDTAPATAYIATEYTGIERLDIINHEFVKTAQLQGYRRLRPIETFGDPRPQQWTMVAAHADGVLILDEDLDILADIRDIKTNAMFGYFLFSEYGELDLRLPAGTWYPSYRIVLIPRGLILSSTGFMGALGSIIVLVALFFMIRWVRKKRRRDRQRGALLRLSELTEPITHGSSAMVMTLSRMTLLLRGTNAESLQRRNVVAKEIRDHLLPDMGEMSLLLCDACMPRDLVARFEQCRQTLIQDIQWIHEHPQEALRSGNATRGVVRAEAILQEMRNELEARFEADLEQVLQVCLDAAWLRDYPNLKVSLPPAGQGRCVIRCDSTELRRVVTELLENAARATAEQQEPRVQVTLEMGVKDLHVLVSDNGQGIPEGDLEHCFDLGWSGGGSTGTGLFHARRRIRRFGGDLMIRSSRQHLGTTMDLVLPRQRGAHKHSDPQNGQSMLKQLRAES